jgi:hypothetical protein
MFRPPRRANRNAALAALALLSLAGCNPAAGNGAADAPGEIAPAPADIALFSSLPIAQPEGASMSDLLSGDAPSHWAVGVLAERGKWRAVDWLGIRDDGWEALAAIDLLILAQPRALAPEENVALDEFVRGGGAVLLFADPELTQDSAYPLGDRRRPLSGVLLSPILARWGIALERDDADRASGVQWNGVSLPLSRAGRFTITRESGEFAGECALEADDRLVACAIGEGRLLAVADAALLEPDSGETAQTRAALLDRLIGSALGPASGKSRD